MDKIDLSAIDANGELGGSAAFVFRGAGQPAAPKAGSLWTEAAGDSTIVYADIGGDGVADMRIDLWDAAVKASDFIL